MSSRVERKDRIFKAIVAVMRELGPIAKDAQNKDQKYPYRSIEAIYNRVNPLFAKHGIFGVPRVVSKDRQTGQTRSGTVMHWSIVEMEYTFYAEDGSSVTVTVMGEGMDTSDKAYSKAQTIAHKIAIGQLLNIPFTATNPEEFTPQWAQAFVGRISLDDLLSVKRMWLKEVKQGECGDKSRMAREFGDWVAEATGRELDGSDHRQWTAEDYNACLLALSGEPGGEPSGEPRTGKETADEGEEGNQAKGNQSRKQGECSKNSSHRSKG